MPSTMQRRHDGTHHVVRCEHGGKEERAGDDASGETEQHIREEQRQHTFCGQGFFLGMVAILEGVSTGHVIRTTDSQSLTGYSQTSQKD